MYIYMYKYIGIYIYTYINNIQIWCMEESLSHGQRLKIGSNRMQVLKEEGGGRRKNVDLYSWKNSICHCLIVKPCYNHQTLLIFPPHYFDAPPFTIAPSHPPLMARARYSFLSLKWVKSFQQPRSDGARPSLSVDRDDVPCDHSQGITLSRPWWCPLW